MTEPKCPLTDEVIIAALATLPDHLSYPDMKYRAIATAAYRKGLEDAKPSRAEIEAAIRSAWNHFGSIDHITRKLFKEIEG